MLIAIEATHANKDNRTGIENVCWHLIKEMKRIIPSNTRVVLYSNKSLSGELAKMPNPNWSVKILKWPFGKGWSQFRLSWEFLFNKPDVFLAPGQLVPFISPKNTISIVHDSAFRVFPFVYWWGSRWYLRFMNWLLSKKSKIIITPSQFSKQEFLKYYKFAEKNIKVVPWGYDKERYKLQDTSNKKISNIQYPISNYIIPPYILSIGRLEEKKNTINIIRAFNLLKNNQDNSLKLKADSLQLVLVGSPGVGYEKIKLEINNSPYAMDIITPGYISLFNLPVLLQKAEVFVFPSLYEGFGLPILEAMACGCPVIASQGHCLEEVGGEAIEYINSQSIDQIAEKIIKLTKDHNYRDNKIKQGLQRVKEFSWQKSGQAIYRIIEEII